MYESREALGQIEIVLKDWIGRKEGGKMGGGGGGTETLCQLTAPTSAMRKPWYGGFLKGMNEREQVQHCRGPRLVPSPSLSSSPRASQTFPSVSSGAPETHEHLFPSLCIRQIRRRENWRRRRGGRSSGRKGRGGSGCEEAAVMGEGAGRAKESRIRICDIFGILNEGLGT